MLYQILSKVKNTGKERYYCLICDFDICYVCVDKFFCVFFMFVVMFVFFMFCADKFFFMSYL